jgi:hypothetical protein
MTDKEFDEKMAEQLYLIAQIDLKRFYFKMKALFLIFFSMFLFGMAGLLFLRVTE